MNTPNAPLQQPQAQPMHDPDEINLLEYLYVLVHRKRLIIGVSFAGLVIGLAAAYIKGPSWVSSAIIAPKESDSKQVPSLSGFGAFGGLVASQLNIGGNASLDKIDMILRKFSTINFKSR